MFTSYGSPKAFFCQDADRIFAGKELPFLSFASKEFHKEVLVNRTDV